MVSTKSMLINCIPKVINNFLGGLRAAYMAYLKNIRDNGEELPLLDLNFTSRQLFWVSAASQW